MSGHSGGLAGRVIAVTRAAAQSEEMAAAIRAAGGEAIAYPLIDIRRRPLGPLRAALAQWPDAFVFTSENGVAALSAALGAPDVNGGAAPGEPVPAYCVGAATAKRAAQLGLAAVAAPAPHSAERLAEFLCATLAPTTNVLWLRGNLADTSWAASVKAAGIAVSDIVVYETVTGGAAEQLAADAQDGMVDALTFASASAVDVFAAAWAEAGRKTPPTQPIFAIGEKTRAALVRRGLPVAARASVASAGALVDAVEAYFAEKQ